MRRLLVGMVLAAATALSSPAHATDVINQDQKGYKITIVDGSYTTSANVGVRSSVYGLCTSGPCTFKIKGSSITAGKNEKLVINGGQLKKM
jgi:hypothetical protein